MGTNFYWHIPGVELDRYVKLPNGEEISIGADHLDPKIHIGKRSAAGLYCWDCDVTLCMGGITAVHYCTHDWFDACPQCGKQPVRSKGSISNAVAVELGLQSPRGKRPSGVTSCSSFSWAQKPSKTYDILHSRKAEVLVENEYSELYTGMEFLDLLAGMPIHYTDGVGQWFS